MGKTLEELKKENVDLKIKEESKNDLLKIENERIRLQKENDRLKHPNKYAILENIKKLSINIGKGARKFSEQFQQPVPQVQKKQGQQTLTTIQQINKQSYGEYAQGIPYRIQNILG